MAGKPPDGGWKQGFPAVVLVTGGAVTQVVDVLDLYAMGSGLGLRSPSVRHMVRDGWVRQRSLLLVRQTGRVRWVFLAERLSV